MTCFILLRINEKELGRQIWKFTKRFHLPFSGGHLNYMSHQIEMKKTNFLSLRTRCSDCSSCISANSVWYWTQVGNWNCDCAPLFRGAPKEDKIGKSWNQGTSPHYWYMFYTVLNSYLGKGKHWLKSNVFPNSLLERVISWKCYHSFMSSVISDVTLKIFWGCTKKCKYQCKHRFDQ